MENFRIRDHEIQDRTFTSDNNSNSITKIPYLLLEFVPFTATHLNDELDSTFISYTGVNV